MFTWTNGDGKQITISHNVAEFDQELVALALKEGAIVNVSTASGAFNFVSNTYVRALRCAMKGETLILPCGKVLQVTDN